MSGKENFSPGKLPDDVMDLIQHFVSYSKEYREAKQKNLFEPISEFKKQWKDQFRNPDKRMEMIISIGTVDSDNQKIWKLFLDSLYDMIDYQNKLNKNIKNNLTRYLSNKIAQYQTHSKIPSLVEWNRKSNRGINDIVEMKVEFQLLVAESGKDITATSLKKIWHDSREKRNCCEHIEQYLNGLVYGLTEEQHRDTFVTFFKLLDNGIDSQKKDLMNYFSFIGIGEGWGGVSKPDRFTYYTKQVQNRDWINEIKTENVLSAMELREWKEYIPVICTNQYGENDKHGIDFLLGYFEEGINVVEINGEGGRGKTALAAELIRRVQVQESVPIKRFKETIIFTSKTEEQGELDTEKSNHDQSSMINIVSPQDPTKSLGGYFLRNGDFENFMAHLQRFLVGIDDFLEEDKLINYYKENRILIVIDNFEDVSLEHKKKYFTFLAKLHGGKTKVIVTGRPKEYISTFHKIHIGKMSNAEATLLLLTRFEFLMKNSPRVFKGRTNHLNELMEIKAKNRNLLKQLIDGIDDLKLQATLKSCVSHPQDIFYLASLLGDTEIQKEIDIDGTIGVAEYIAKVAAEPKYGFQQFHDNQLTWSTEKAYDIVVKDHHCKLVIDALKENPSLKQSQIKEYFFENETDTDQVPRAIQRLEMYNNFIEKEDASDAYILKEDVFRLFIDEPNTQKTIAVDNYNMIVDFDVLHKDQDKNRRSPSMIYWATKTAAKIISAAPSLKKDGVGYLNPKMKVVKVKMGRNPEYMVIHTVMTSDNHPDVEKKMRLIDEITLYETATEDLEKARKLSSNLENYVLVEDVLTEIIEAKIPLDKRTQIAGETIHHTVSALALLKNQDIESSLREKLESLRRMIRIPLFRHLEKAGSKIITGMDYTTLIDYSIRLMADENDVNVRKNWMEVISPNIFNIWHELPDGSKHDAFKIIREGNALDHDDSQEESVLLSWLKIHAAFQTSRFYNSKDDAVNPIQCMADWVKSGRDLNNFIENRLDTNVKTNIRKFISTWAPALDWDSKVYTLMSHLDINVEKKDWEGATEWKRYTIVPSIDEKTSKYTDIEFRLFNMNNDTQIERQVGESYTCTRESYNPIENIMKLRVVEVLQEATKEEEPKDVPQEYIDLVRNTLEEMIKESASGSVGNNELGSELKQKNGERPKDKLKGTIHPKFAKFVTSQVIPLFGGGVEVTSEGKENQSYREIGVSPKANEDDKVEIERWITSTKRGHPGYPSDPKSALDILRKIKPHLNTKLENNLSGSPQQFAQEFQNTISEEDVWSKKELHIKKLEWITAYKSRECKAKVIEIIDMVKFLELQLNREISNSDLPSNLILAANTWFKDWKSKLIKMLEPDELERKFDSSQKAPRKVEEKPYNRSELNDRLHKAKKNRKKTAREIQEERLEAKWIQEREEEKSKLQKDEAFRFTAPILSPTWVRITRSAILVADSGEVSFREEMDRAVGKYSSNILRLKAEYPSYELWQNHLCKQLFEDGLCSQVNIDEDDVNCNDSLLMKIMVSFGYPEEDIMVKLSETK